MKRADVIVCVFLGMTCLGLLLPLIVYAQQAQDSRVETANRMRSCASAVHIFNDAYRRLPPAYGPGGSGSGEARSFWFHLLSYVQADSVYKQSDYQASVTAFLGPQDPSLGK